MYCPKCGRKNPEGARFCMHCGADLSGYKVEISPKIQVSPKIEVKPNIHAKPTSSVEMCAICGKSKAVAVCKKCGRPVCAHHFEHGAECTLCRISEFTETLNLFRTGLSNNQLRVKENPESKFWKEAVESDKGHVEFYEKLIKELKRKL